MRFFLVNTFIFLLYSSVFSQKLKNNWDYRPKCFPFILAAVDIYERAQFIDFENDGLIETVTLSPHEQDGTPPHFEIRDQNNKFRHRENYDPETVLMPPVSFIDMNDDLKPELYLPILRNDSLFVDIFAVSNSVKRVCRIFITRGQPRRIDDGTIYPWQPRIRDAFYIDIDGEGNKKLISIVRSFHARVKRGVYIHSYPNGELISSFLLGAQPNQAFIEDFDNDGVLELVMHTSTPINGAEVNGFSDSFSYLIWFELSPHIYPKHSICISTGYNVEASAFYDNFVGDKEKEFLTITMASESDAKAELRIISPLTLKTDQLRQYNFKVETVTPFHSPDFHHVHLLFSKRNGLVAAIDEALNVDSLFVWPEKISAIKLGPDINNDGYNEYILQGIFNSVLFDYHFNLLAMWPLSNYMGTRRAIRSGHSEYILNEASNSNVIYEIKQNRFYWVHRYIIPIISIFVTSFFLIVFLFALKEHIQHKSITRYIAHLVESDTRAIAIVDKKLRVLNSNQLLLEWFAIDHSTKRKSLMLDEWLKTYPDLVTIIREWRDGYSHIRREKFLALNIAKGMRSLKLIYEPVPRSLLAKRVFQISFIDRSVQSELEKIERWKQMAQRIAHDLKNPLGTIQMILQKLRTTTIRQHGNTEVEVLPYYDKIDDRVESLRKMIRNFLKFVSLEAPHLVATNITKFLSETLDIIAVTIPTDIELIREIPDDIIAVDVDIEQMTSVLENLIANAIDAMPQGGSIRVSLSMAQQLQFPGYDDQPHSYALLEVRDTGIGIPPEVLNRLFEPKFSYFKESSGLGLAIAKKIIDDHHGHIEVESEVDIGTLVTIYFPIRKNLKSN